MATNTFRDSNFTGAVSITSELTVSGTATLNGNTVLGNAATDTITCTGRLILREIANTTSTPGSKKEVVYCTGDNKLYVCTVGSETAATWVALN